jgi:hypothetical protein
LTPAWAITFESMTATDMAVRRVSVAYTILIPPTGTRLTHTEFAINITGKLYGFLSQHAIGLLAFQWLHRLHTAVISNFDHLRYWL